MGSDVHNSIAGFIILLPIAYSAIIIAFDIGLYLNYIFVCLYRAKARSFVPPTNNDIRRYLAFASNVNGFIRYQTARYFYLIGFEITVPIYVACYRRSSYKY